jgi:hypothetical protein
MEYYIAIILLMAVVAFLFWKLGYARGMLEAMQEQTAQEQVRMWANFYGGDDE